MARPYNGRAIFFSLETIDKTIYILYYINSGECSPFIFKRREVNVYGQTYWQESSL